MAATLTGTPVAVTWASGINPAGQTVNIPSDATAVYFFWSFYHGTAGHGLASVTLGGNAPSQTFEVPTATGDQTATGVAVWYNPATGNQTLDPAWDAAPAEGSTTVVAFVKGGDTTAWRDADAANESSGNACSVTLTTQSGDLVLMFDQHFSGTAPAAPSGWAGSTTHVNNSEASRLSSISATGSTQACTCQSPDYASVVAVSIPAGATGTTVSAPTSTHTYTGAAPKVNARVQPGAATHSYTGRAPTVVGTLRATVATHSYTGRAPQAKAQVKPGAATHSYAGQAPQVKARIQPAAVTHSYAGQAPKVNARVQPGVATHTYVGRVPTTSAGNALNAPAASHSYAGVAPQVKAQVRAVVATHSYTGRVPVATAGASVQPGAATHSYQGRAPQVKAQVRAAVVTHSYTARAPGFVRTVAVPGASHSYVGRAPKANVQVRAPVAAHSYVLLAPQVAEGEIALFGWGARNRIGRATASDRWQRIGSESATGEPGRIGSETATGTPGTIGSDDA